MMYEAFWLGKQPDEKPKPGAKGTTTKPVARAAPKSVLSEFEQERQRILALQQSQGPPTPTE
jgi:hypothetical protein